MAVKLVTDSSCDLPGDLARQWGITVVPCNIHFDDRVYKDGVDIGPDEFYDRLVASPRLPTTAQPSVNDFVEVYRPLLDEGHQVVSVHLSAKFSGTLNSAFQARDTLTSGDSGATVDPERIRIVDSQLTSMPLGMVALETARAISEGADAEAVVQAATDTIERCHCYFLLDTLEYLQKGGRIGKASAFLGSLLSIKPILTIRDGEAHAVERARTRVRGLQRLVDLVRGLAPVTRLSVIYSTGTDEAEALRSRLGDLGPADDVVMARFGPVVGTYLGPGALGVSVLSSK